MEKPNSLEDQQTDISPDKKRMHDRRPSHVNVHNIMQYAHADSLRKAETLLNEATETKRMESVEDMESMGVPSPGLRLQARPRRGSDDQSSDKQEDEKGDSASKHLGSGTELTSPQYKTIPAFEQYSQKQSS